MSTALTSDMPCTKCLLLLCCALLFMPAGPAAVLCVQSCICLDSESVGSAAAPGCSFGSLDGAVAHDMAQLPCCHGNAQVSCLSMHAWLRAYGSHLQPHSLPGPLLLAYAAHYC
jgi:hypothetical protein